MIKWIKEYIDAYPQTKYFVLNWGIYGLAIIITTVYCYGRLPFVENKRKPPPSQEKNQISNQQTKQ